MNVLLDTHILLWWLADDRRLKKPARDILADARTQVCVSVVSFWEIVIKTASGRLAVNVQDVLGAVSNGGYSILPIHARHVLALTELPQHHDDPFDRMLVAQAAADSMRLLTHDHRIAPYGSFVQQV